MVKIKMANEKISLGLLSTNLKMVKSSLNSLGILFPSSIYRDRLMSSHRNDQKNKAR
jgi:hypothetical protein